jgi:hypothetical protein
MRIVMLVARTGWRVSEIRMLDRQPLLPLDRLTVPADDDGDGFVAKLRYQQTKIDGAHRAIPHPLSSTRPSESRALSRQMTGLLRFSTVLRNLWGSRSRPVPLTWVLGALGRQA